MWRRLLLVCCLLSVAGCSALGQNGDEPLEHRVVVENGYEDARTVTVAVDTDGGGPVANETRRLEPGEQWTVWTLNGSAGESTGYSVEVSTAGTDATDRHRGQASGPGATLVVIGGGEVLTCGGNVTCYE
jgi:hypothetical protein